MKNKMDDTPAVREVLKEKRKLLARSHYVITRQNKVTGERLQLSQGRRRWLHIESIQRRCKFTEAEADFFIKEFDLPESKYYYVKELSQ